MRVATHLHVSLLSAPSLCSLLTVVPASRSARPTATPGGCPPAECCRASASAAPGGTSPPARSGRSGHRWSARSGSWRRPGRSRGAVSPRPGTSRGRGPVASTRSGGIEHRVPLPRAAFEPLDGREGMQGLVGPGGDRRRARGLRSATGPFRSRRKLRQPSAQGRREEREGGCSRWRPARMHLLGIAAGQRLPGGGRPPRTSPP